MLSILKEKIICQGISLAQTSALYQSDAQQLVAKYIRWLNDTEESIASLRTPLSLTIQAERTTILAIGDGLIPDGVQPSKSTRKLARAATAISIEKVSLLLQEKVREIDLFFEQILEQLCQAAAIVQSLKPQTYSSLNAEFGPSKLWQEIKQTKETVQIHNYLCAKVSVTDRNYLLTEVVQRILSNA